MRINDQDAGAHLERGLLLLEMGEREKAVEAIGKALARADWKALLQEVEAILPQR